MESFSFTPPPPPSEPAEWRWGGPKPDGYRWPPGTLTPGLLLTCERCGAAVFPGSALGLHDAWHARQD